MRAQNRAPAKSETTRSWKLINIKSQTNRKMTNCEKLTLTGNGKLLELLKHLKQQINELKSKCIVILYFLRINLITDYCFLFFSFFSPQSSEKMLISVLVLSLVFNLCDAAPGRVGFPLNRFPGAHKLQIKKRGSGRV